MNFALWPSHTADSAYEINYEALFARGIRGLIFDIDSTLVPHDADADESARSLMKRLKDIGFSICFVSNNDEARVKRFNREIGAEAVCLANKPSRGGYQKAMAKMGTLPSTTVAIGDQLFTDVWGANRAGIENFCVAPVGADRLLQIRLKRLPEKLLLAAYRKMKE